jgi:hypothetical protein
VKLDERRTATTLSAAALYLTFTAACSATPGHDAAGPASVAASRSVRHAAVPRQAPEVARSPALRTPFWGPVEPVAARVASNPHHLYFGTIAVHGRHTDAVWDIPAPGNHRLTLFRFSASDAGGRWSPARTIARTSHWLNPTLAAGPDGAALLTWNLHTARRTRIMEVHREPAGAWTSPHQLASGPYVSSLNRANAVIDSRGVIAVVWTSARDRVMVASLRNGQWSDARVLGTGGDPVIAANGHGDLAVAWATVGGLAVAVGHPDGTWDPTHKVPTAIEFGVPHVALDNRGRVLAMETRNPVDAQVGGRRHIAWARSRLDGTWSPTGYLDSRRRAVFGTGLDLAMSPTGRAFAIWWVDTGGGSTIHNESAARYRPIHGWTQPRDMGTGDNQRAMLAPDGTAVFSGWDASHSVTVWGYQRPGGRWHISSVGGMYLSDAAAGDWRMGILYDAPRLKARILHVPHAPHRPGPTQATGAAGNRSAMGSPLLRPSAMSHQRR